MFTQWCSAFKFNFDHSFYTIAINIIQGKMFFQNIKK